LVKSLKLSLIYHLAVRFSFSPFVFSHLFLLLSFPGMGLLPPDLLQSFKKESGKEGEKSSRKSDGMYDFVFNLCCTITSVVDMVISSLAFSTLFSSTPVFHNFLLFYKYANDL